MSEVWQYCHGSVRPLEDLHSVRSELVARSSRLEAKTGTARERDPIARKPVLAVDWDGTCVEGVWPDQGHWLPGAKKALKKLTEKYTVMIWSTRIVGVSYYDWNEKLDPYLVDLEINYIRAMLDAAGLEEVDIFISYPDYEPGKLSAVAYIDDKAIRFDGDWPRTLRQLNRLGV